MFHVLGCFKLITLFFVIRLRAEVFIIKKEKKTFVVNYKLSMSYHHYQVIVMNILEV